MSEEEMNDKEPVKYGEGVKFERHNIEYEQDEFVRIRNEYNIRERG